MTTKAKVAIGGGLAAVLALAAPLIAKWEGVRYEPYRDAVGVLTVCEGITGPEVVAGKKYTRAECDAMLSKHMLIANGHVRECIPVRMLPQIEAALTSLVFNVGPRSVCGSTIQRLALENDWPAACEAINEWKYAGGRVLPGLVRRRAEEAHLCLTGR